ncbi:MAG: lectin [Gemmatimonadetes bacterium]|nr:lectin [Gemmatimonadota bacterium]NIR77001.1 lectin [Gemmatimonadota bacterium]NIT88924.1 lectin [Gemmatimonadota bacterium]NIU29356.1 lectin [Gemmatimonadota bacterium]NIU34416.1 lectin [Gemmatimonadota bacterium]
MTIPIRAAAIPALALFALVLAPKAQAQEEGEAEMGFFITSEGPGNGADLGGLEGADAHCQALAEAAGAGHRTWHAYLSTQATDSEPAVHARDRIGEGPWANANGLRIAADVDDLHYNNANIRYEYALDERGETVGSGALGDPVTRHDILTGTRLDGTAFPQGQDRTCSNWTSSSSEGSAMVGHHDRYSFDTPGSPWNSSHPSRGCSQENLEATGGDGLFYCFAVE